MARLVLCALALLVAGSLSTPVKKVPHKVADKTLAQRQYDLATLFYHIYEPIHIETCHTISQTWNIEENIKHFNNKTAVKTYVEMWKHNWVLPRGVPFSIVEDAHRFEAVTLFHVLYSAKTYDVFYKTAVYYRDRVNEGLFVYVFSIAILNRPDTQGIRIPPIYETFPWYFNNGEIMTSALRINTHRHNMLDHYQSTYLWDESIVIRWNETTWPYYNSESTPISYFTHDFGLNAFYYNTHLSTPSWLGGEVVPLVKDRRGEWFWFIHKQIVTRYYMERLSNGLGEIHDLGHEIVKYGYYSGLFYHSGISFPVRPNYFYLDQPDFVDKVQKITDYERRIRDAIEKGCIGNCAGEHINLRTPESIDILGNLIEGNVDSPNVGVFKDFISIWKNLLGNSIVHEHQYYNQLIPLVVPSVLDNYQTALRDPAFYMIAKHVLGLFELWQEHLPHYKPEELALPSVAIEKVDVDKLVTYFEHTYMNVTNALYMNEEETRGVSHQVSVLVQHPRLNHKTFQVRVHVNSEVAKTVVVRFFLAPKYNSHGYEIPLHLNTQNFFLLDEFLHDLPVGESVIVRESGDNAFATQDWESTVDICNHAYKTAQGHGQYTVDAPENFVKLPHRLLLPKGRVGGMPFVLMVYISEYHAPKVPYGTGFDPSVSLGLGSGARFLTDDPLGFPVNRPIYVWQVKDLKNLWLQDVLIHHKHTPEVEVPHTE